jgi:hypothetical protein
MFLKTVLNYYFLDHIQRLAVILATMFQKAIAMQITQTTPTDQLPCLYGWFTLMLDFSMFSNTQATETPLFYM